MGRFYSNENFPRKAVRALRLLGHDVKTTSQAGQANQGTGDPEALAYAMAEQRAMLTLDKDFLDPRWASKGHWGIVHCRDDRDYPALAQRIHDAVAPLEDLRGKLIKIEKA